MINFAHSVLLWVVSRARRNELEELTKFGNLKGLGRSGGDRDDLGMDRLVQSCCVCA